MIVVRRIISLMDFIQKADDQGSESLETIEELTSAVAVAIFLEKGWVSRLLSKARRGRGQLSSSNLQELQDVVTTKLHTSGSNHKFLSSFLMLRSF